MERRSQKVVPWTHGEIASNYTYVYNARGQQPPMNLKASLHQFAKRALKASYQFAFHHEGKKDLREKANSFWIMLRWNATISEKGNTIISYPAFKTAQTFLSTRKICPCRNMESLLGTVGGHFSASCPEHTYNHSRSPHADAQKPSWWTMNFPNSTWQAYRNGDWYSISIASVIIHQRTTRTMVLKAETAACREFSDHVP